MQQLAEFYCQSISRNPQNSNLYVPISSLISVMARQAGTPTHWLWLTSKIVFLCQVTRIKFCCHSLVMMELCPCIIRFIEYLLCFHHSSKCFTKFHLILRRNNVTISNLQVRMLKHIELKQLCLPPFSSPSLLFAVFWDWICDLVCCYFWENSWLLFLQIFFPALFSLVFLRF